MITISDGILNIPECERFVGFTGDNNHTQKKFFIRKNPESGWLYRLYLTFDDGRQNFFTLPATTVQEGIILEWNIQENHILKSGLVRAQIKAFSENNEVYHTTSDVFVAGKTAEEDEFFKNSNSEFLAYEKTLNDLYRKMTTASAKMPYVGENGNWFVYDESADAYMDSGVSSSAGVADGTITPEKLDRSYLEWQNRTTVSTYADLDNIITTDTSLNTVYTVMFTGLSPIKSLVGDGTFFAMKSNTADSLLLINIDNGEMWSYTRGIDSLTRVCGDSENISEALAKKINFVAINLPDGSNGDEELKEYLALSGTGYIGTAGGGAGYPFMFESYTAPKGVYVVEGLNAHIVQYKKYLSGPDIHKKYMRMYAHDGVEAVWSDWQSAEPDSSGAQIIELGTFEASDIQSYAFEEGVLYKLDYYESDCLAVYESIGSVNYLKYISLNSGKTGRINTSTGEVEELNGETVINIGDIYTIEDLRNYDFVEGNLYIGNITGALAGYELGHSIIYCDLSRVSGTVVFKTVYCISICRNVRGAIDTLEETIDIVNYDTKLATLDERLRAIESSIANAEG